MKVENGAMRMREITDLEIPTNGNVAMEPGGNT